MEELKWAAQNGDLDKVKLSYAQGNFNIDADLGGGRTALHCAADYGQTEIVKYLLSEGANVNALDKHGISPLLNAVFEGHTDCVKVLLEKGANKNQKTPDGATPYEAAEKEEICNLLS